MSMCICEDCGRFFDSDYDCEGFSTGKVICDHCYFEGDYNNE